MKKKSISQVKINESIIQVCLKNVEKNSLFVSEIFKIISRHNVNVDMISSIMLSDEMQIDFTADENCQSQLNEAIIEIQKNHPRIEMYSYKNIGKISISGDMAEETGVAYHIFKIFADCQISFRQVTTSETSMDFVIEKKYLKTIYEKIKEMM